jgi:hypothetical protein
MMQIVSFTLDEESIDILKTHSNMSVFVRNLIKNSVLESEDGK